MNFWKINALLEQSDKELFEGNLKEFTELNAQARELFDATFGGMFDANILDEQ